MRIVLVTIIIAAVILIGDAIGDAGRAVIGDSIVPATLDCTEDEVIATTPDGVRCVHIEQVNE